jgi:ketosteroid isomerase-like protein
MPERNVELIRRVVEALSVQDVDVLSGFCDPSVDLNSTFAAVGGAVYHGHEGLRMWRRDLAEAWGEIRNEPEAYFDLGEHTLVFYVLRARGRHSGAEVAMLAALVARWRDGLIVYMKSYSNREDALCDLGVSEDELEPIEP